MRAVRESVCPFSVGGCTENIQFAAGWKEGSSKAKQGKKGSACKFSFACAQFGPASRTRSSSKLEARYGKKLRESSRPREKKR